MEQIKKLEEKIELLEQKLEHYTDSFNQLIEKLNNAELKTIMTFDDLEIQEEYEDTTNEEIDDNII